MSNDERRGANDRTDQQNQSEEEKKSKQREALERFGQYAAPAMVAVLLSERSVHASAVVSDIRVKRDIAPVGRMPNGLNLYRYRYLWSETFFVGVMAHEVAAVNPNAVRRGADGYDRVDYVRLGLRLQTWDRWTAAA